MATTYTLISSNVLGSNASSVTISSIPQTYTDLVLRTSTRNTFSDIYQLEFLEISGNAGTVYSYTRMSGTGSTAISNQGVTGTFSWMQTTFGTGSNATASTFSNNEFYIPNYTNTTMNKQISFHYTNENNASAAILGAGAGRYGSNGAVTQLKFTISGSANIVAGSSFYLYGIKNS
jgi:hypothetical protein